MNRIPIVNGMPLMWRRAALVAALALVGLLMIGLAATGAEDPTRMPDAVQPLSMPTYGDSVELRITVTLSCGAPYMDMEYWVVRPEGENIHGTVTPLTGTTGVIVVAPITRGLGTVDVCVKGESTLRKCASGTLDAWVNGVNVGTLKGGDANNDNNINGADLAVLAPAYFTSVGDPDWDARGDLNKDGTITGADLACMAPNYFEQGEAAPF
jgi:hypothetical protein